MNNNLVTNEMTKKVEALVKSGKSLQEALEVVLAEIVKPVAVGRIDHVAYIKGLRNIPEVKRVRKIAYAKISKSKGKVEAIARYKLEIEEADKKLNELLAEVDAAASPWEKSMELGEDAAAAFNYYFLTLKINYDMQMEFVKKQKSMTNAQLKAALQDTKVAIPSSVPKVLQPVMLDRINNGDMMVITTAKKVSLISKLSKTE